MTPCAFGLGTTLQQRKQRAEREHHVDSLAFHAPITSQVFGRLDDLGQEIPANSQQAAVLNPFDGREASAVGAWHASFDVFAFNGQFAGAAGGPGPGAVVFGHRRTIPSRCDGLV